jgi:hypothetical protein
VGWRTVFRRGPFQSHAIAIWSALAAMTIQGYQIDTDHWRHFYLMLGLIWGIASAAHLTEPARSTRMPSPALPPRPALPPPSAL